MKTELNEYEQQAQSFLDSTNTEFKAEFLKYDKHFDADKEKRDIYKITLKRGSREFSLNFGQSLNNSGLQFKNKNTGRVYRVIETDKYFEILNKHKTSKSYQRMAINQLLPFPVASCDELIYPEAPTAYDVLACLTKYDPGTFEDFCSEFGYEEDSRSAEKTYNAVKDEYLNVCTLYNDEELELMAEIQ
jgi:hypothetical protein